MLKPEIVLARLPDTPEETTHCSFSARSGNYKAIMGRRKMSLRLLGISTIAEELFCDTACLLFNLASSFLLDNYPPVIVGFPASLAVGESE
jgi:hypothetical protein